MRTGNAALAGGLQRAPNPIDVWTLESKGCYRLPRGVIIVDVPKALSAGCFFHILSLCVRSFTGLKGRNRGLFP